MKQKKEASEKKKGKSKTGNKKLEKTPQKIKEI